MFNYEIATQWIFNVNTIVLILGTPIIIKLIAFLKDKGFHIPVDSQFKYAFIFLAISFFSLGLGIKLSDQQGYTNIGWIIFYFISESIGELLIAPVGYAMIGKIIPEELQGLLMGTWMMISGIAVSISHYFSNTMMKTASINPLQTNYDYWLVFNKLGIYALLGALFLYYISKSGKFIELKSL